MNDIPFAETIEQILEETRLSAEDVSSRLEMARDPSYWAALSPALSVSGDGSAPIAEARTLDDEALAVQTRALVQDGYFEMTELVPGGVVEQLRVATEAVRSAGWPATFAFVYDQFWQILTLPSLARLMASHLGGGYRLVPHAWLFYVPATPGAKGWPPHADAPDRLGRLTLWIPLTSATIENGCMYVVPRSMVPTAAVTSFVSQGSMPHDDVVSLCQASRALPAKPGTVLGWDHQLIHWGSMSRGAREPRISVSVEFIARDETPRPDELPLLMAGGRLPTLAERLMVIARAVQSYRRFEPLLVRFQDLADRLIAGAV